MPSTSTVVDPRDAAAVAASTASVSSQAAPSNAQAPPAAASSGGTGGYTPAQIRQAYGINQATLPNGQPATGAGQTIAIIDPSYDPNIQSDLATFDAQFGLAAPPSFQQVVYPGTQGNADWARETALDVEWAHAIAPGANILLVETPMASNGAQQMTNYLQGVSYAASQPGVVAVSMSYAGQEWSSEANSLDWTFQTPSGHVGGSNLPGGITFVAASGDGGAYPPGVGGYPAGPNYPASSPFVLAVGGTSLNLNSAGGYGSETTWYNSYGGSGGGYSRVEAEPPFQRGVQNTGYRATPDVSLNANPATGQWFYNSYGLASGQSGWSPNGGGTSIATPEWAGIMALVDQARAGYGLGSLGNAQAAVYSLPSSDFHDITTGSNGYPAGPGYDLSTGLGTPIVNRVVTDLARVG